MAARITMTSSAGHGRRMAPPPPRQEVYKSVGGKIFNPKPQNRRTETRGGGGAFVGLANRHPFATGFLGTLIAIKTIRGDKVTS